LVAYRQENARSIPGGYNGAVPSFGDENARLVIVGMAPGRMGANRTGRPFTGDYAGILLYETLLKFGFATGSYDARPDDGLQLVDCMITNAVRCAPPENKTETSEENACRPFLTARLAALPRVQAILTLGLVSHRNVVKTLGGKIKDAPFSHGGHSMVRGLHLYSSYHCSRYNTNTGRLTAEMFEGVFLSIQNYLKF
jgi:uracil-DNA glycosylase family 4